MTCPHLGIALPGCPCPPSCACRGRSCPSATPGDIRRHVEAEAARDAALAAAALGAAPVGSLDAVLSGYARKIEENKSLIKRLVQRLAQAEARIARLEGRE